MADPVLITWVVYDHPRDFPNHFVVRGQAVVPGSPEPQPLSEAALYDTLEAAREELAGKGLVRLERSPGDDPVIVEVWL